MAPYSGVLRSERMRKKWYFNSIEVRKVLRLIKIVSKLKCLKDFEGLLTKTDTVRVFITKGEVKIDFEKDDRLVYSEILEKPLKIMYKTMKLNEIKK
jgi:hypothetical protein